jgi:dephospho-CoA kinase
MAARIAITGGIAEGKSTVLGYLAESGLRIASADEIARDVYDLTPVQEALAHLTRVEGPVSRILLRERLAEEPDLRRKVNLLMHPYILKGIEASIADAIEVPLLLETCLYGMFNRVWVVTCGPQEQLRRLTQRLGSEDAARGLISTQLTSRAKCAFADTIVRTNAEELSVKRSVIEALAI